MFVTVMIVVALLLGLRLCIMAASAGIAVIMLNEERLEKFFDTAVASLK